MSGDAAAQAAAAAAAMAMMNRHEPTGGRPAREHDHTPAAAQAPALAADMAPDFVPVDAAPKRGPKAAKKAPPWAKPAKVSKAIAQATGTNARAVRAKAKLEAAGGRRITFNCSPEASMALASLIVAGLEQTEAINKALIHLSKA